MVFWSKDMTEDIEESQTLQRIEAIRLELKSVQSLNSLSNFICSWSPWRDKEENFVAADRQVVLALVDFLIFLERFKRVGAFWRKWVVK